MVTHHTIIGSHTNDSLIALTRKLQLLRPSNGLYWLGSNLMATATFGFSPAFVTVDIFLLNHSANGKCYDHQRHSPIFNTRSSWIPSQNFLSRLMKWNKRDSYNHVLFWNFAATNTCINPNKNVNFLLYNCIKTAILMCTQMKYEWCLIRFSFPTLCWNGNVINLKLDAKYCIMLAIY